MEQQVRVSKSVLVSLFTSRLTKALGILLISIVVVYVLIAATLVRAIPSTSGTGIVLVKNNTFPGGTIPAGTYVMVDRGSVDENGGALAHLHQAFVPSPYYAIVKTTAGPTGSLQWEAPDKLTIDGTPAPLPMKADSDGNSPLLDHKDTGYLRNQYAGECISGDCATGEMVIVDAKQVIGIVIGDSSGS